MSQMAVGYKHASNGRQQRSDGLVKHTGLGEFAGLRLGTTLSGNAVSPLTGRGLEIGFHDSSKVGYLYCYDRDTGGFCDLQLTGKSIAIFPQGGTLQLPASCIDGSALIDGTVFTPKLAPNAAQQLLGSYVAPPAWSTTANNWVITPVSTSVNVSTTGALLRVEWCLVMAQSLAQGQWITGLGWDGAVQYGVAYTVSPNAGNPVTVSGIWYLSNLGAGAHTISMFVYNVSGGSTLNFYTGVYSTLYVTEQKR